MEARWWFWWTNSTRSGVIDFECVDFGEWRAFGGATALPSVQTDPSDSVDQSMLQLQKPSGPEVWAGVTIAEELLLAVI